MQLLEDNVYCYTGTNVLVNKLDIRDASELECVERHLVGIREISCVDFDFQNYDFGILCGLHKYLFQDVYSWAGEPRKIDIFKGKSDFVSCSDIDKEADKIFSSLADDDLLKGLERDDFCQKISYLLADIDYLHPFREGNGRCERVFVSALARNAGWNLHLEDLSSKRFHEAMIVSRQSTSILESLFRKNVEFVGEPVVGSSKDISLIQRVKNFFGVADKYEYR